MSLDGEFVLHGFVDSPLFGGVDEVRVHVGGDPRVVPDAGLRTEYRYFGRVLVSYRAFDLRLPLAQQQTAQIVVRLRVVGTQRERLPQRLDRFGQSIVQ